MHEPWGSNTCNPEGESARGIIEYHEGTSSDDETYLHSNVVWTPYESGFEGDLELFLHAYVHEDWVSSVMVDYRVIEQGGIYFTGTTGIMSLNSENVVNYNINFGDQHTILMDRTYCIELELKDTIEGTILAEKLGCILTPNGIVDTSQVRWSNSLETGSTWVSSAVEGKEGHLAVDDNYDTYWESESSCQNEDQAIIINLPGYDDGNFHPVSAISLEWLTDPQMPINYEILAWTSDEKWQQLIEVEENFELEYWSRPINHFIGQIDANRIKVVCTHSEDTTIGLTEISIHEWQNANSGGGGILDAFYPNDLSDGAEIYVTSEYGSNSGPKAIDNDFNSFWESNDSCSDSNQDIMIDLEQEYYIGAMKVTWGFSSFDNQYIGGEIKIWNEQNGWIHVMNFEQNPIDEDPEFYLFYPNYGQKIVFKCLSLDLNLKISEIEIFEAKSDWHEFDFDNDGKSNGADQCFIGESEWSSDPLKDYDGDGCFDDTEDWDDDNDGINDEQDNCPKGQFNWNSWDEGTDFDHDGCFDDTEDWDDDADGILDTDDNCLQTRLGAGVDLDGCEISFR